MADIIIVGAGPAGLSAAIYARRAGMDTVLYEGEMYGGQIVNTPEIENYPAIAKISGFDFANDLYNQAVNLGAVLEFDRVVTGEARLKIAGRELRFGPGEGYFTNANVLSALEGSRDAVIKSHIFHPVLPMHRHQRHLIFIEEQKTTHTINGRFLHTDLPFSNNGSKTVSYICSHR